MMCVLSERSPWMEDSDRRVEIDPFKALLIVLCTVRVVSVYHYTGNFANEQAKMKNYFHQ